MSCEACGGDVARGARAVEHLDPRVLCDACLRELKAGRLWRMLSTPEASAVLRDYGTYEEVVEALVTRELLPSMEALSGLIWSYPLRRNGVGPAEDVTDGVGPVWAPPSQVAIGRSRPFVERAPALFPYGARNTSGVDGPPPVMQRTLDFEVSNTLAGTWQIALQSALESLRWGKTPWGLGGGSLPYAGGPEGNWIRSSRHGTALVCGEGHPDVDPGDLFWFRPFSGVCVSATRVLAHQHYCPDPLDLPLLASNWRVLDPILRAWRETYAEPPTLCFAAWGTVTTQAQVSQPSLRYSDAEGLIERLHRRVRAAGLGLVRSINPRILLPV